MYDLPPTVLIKCLIMYSNFSEFVMLFTSLACLTVSPYYCPAPGVNGSSIESTSMGLQRYHETASNRNGLRFPHPPPVNHHHHNYHHPALPMQGVRGHGVNFHPPVTAASFRVPTNPSRGGAIPTHNGFEVGPRHVGPVPSAGLRIYRPHRGVMHETNLGHRNLPPMGFLHVDVRFPFPLTNCFFVYSINASIFLSINVYLCRMLL